MALYLSPTADDAAVDAALAELKASLSRTATFEDNDMKRALKSCSRALDGLCNRRFWQDAEDQTRYYSPLKRIVLDIDDIFETPTRVSASNFVGTFDDVGGVDWTDLTDYTLVPDNAPLDGRPYERIQLRPYPFSSRFMPVWTQRSIRVIAKFGWPTAPDAIEEAMSILVPKFVMRTRQAPFGIVAVSIGTDNSAAMRIARSDPDVTWLLESAQLVRNVLVA